MKTLIVGGVAGGAGTAARLRRLDENAEIILFERGEHISFANCGLPYFIGGVIRRESDLLVQTAGGMRSRFNIDVRTGSEVTKIDRGGRKVHVRTADGRAYEESYDRLVLAPGAKPVVPDIPGVHLPGVFSLRNVPDTLEIRRLAERARGGDAVVVGGGFIGLEMAENLARAGVKVTLMMKPGKQLLPPMDPEMAAYIRAELERHGVRLRPGADLTGIYPDGGGLRVGTSAGEDIRAAMVMLCIGVRPESELARDAGLALGEGGGILVDRHMRTSDPHIYAVGDACIKYNYVSGRSGSLHLAGPANRQARLAADNIAGRPSVFRGVQGTTIIKVFNLACACTGLNEKQLKTLGMQYDKVYLHPVSNAAYYPGGTQITMKLLFAPDGRVLGAQAVGEKGVDKRIDVLATVIAMGGTVYDLEQLELCYAPPYGSAKDPVNMAGFVAAAVLKGDSHLFFWDDPAIDDPDSFLVDIRTPREYRMGTITHAVNIPVDEFRNRLDEFPKDRTIYIFCRVGHRGYVGERILRGHGFKDVRNLSGGILLYNAAK